ncbi:thioredoxin 1 [Capronia coronata CBS 617.96]|uniref:Thioredoxin 1 n=1 Tax=Capronia coronata CBS 617.96 TaxID=1182541 RepID=W9YXW4_9EURO|nr:thioredoxin 1 [Capronia coronata CBS 617.96]EXJ94520.1 thioredoxin 1 [Capronia coronata CBS 617.96]
MGVHNLAEYVAYHQAKLRQEQQQQQQQQARNSSTSTSTTTTSHPAHAKKYGVNPIHSKSSFDTSVLSAPAGRLVVLDCFATWCGPCKVIAPELVKFSESEEFKDKVDFYKIDVDEVPDVAQELGVRAMPTFMLFKNGEKVAEVVGANKKALEQAIRANA